MSAMNHNFVFEMAKAEGDARNALHDQSAALAKKRAKKPEKQPLYTPGFEGVKNQTPGDLKP
jgi:hypothetical protein